MLDHQQDVELAPSGSLPPEVVGLIVKELQQDIQSIKYCTLVNRDWNAECRRFRMGTLLLQEGDHIVELISLLRRCPEFVQYVQAIFIRDGCEGWSYIENENIAALLATASNIRILGLSNMTMREIPASTWNPRHLFSMCKHLRDLRLERCTFESAESLLLCLQEIDCLDNLYLGPAIDFATLEHCTDVVVHVQNLKLSPLGLQFPYMYASKFSSHFRPQFLETSCALAADFVATVGDCIAVLSIKPFRNFSGEQR